MVRVLVVVGTYRGGVVGRVWQEMVVEELEEEGERKLWL